MTKYSRAHTKESGRKLSNNIIASEVKINITRRREAIEIMLPTKVDRLAVAVRCIEFTGECDCYITVHNNDGVEEIRRPIEDAFNLFEVGDVKADSIITVDIDSDEKIEKAFVTLIGNYDGG